MALSAGTRLGPYEILAPIGAGGMGEVYRARDTKLDRLVAIKILPDALMHDPERLARFEREAKLLASLNHPNIAQIYAVQQGALVMELVEGEMLKGPLSLEIALNYAKQIAEALEAAHEKGITHRDLKPANIMVTPPGTVKVLDFGLAKASDEASSDPQNSPTLTISPTRAGMILGTAAYMAPEQARGKTVDKRADIWAFGCVLYEMLTGKQLFHGEAVSDILAAVLKEEPNLDRVPVKVRNLLQRCLEKDPKKRLRDIGDAMPLIAEPPLAPPPRRTLVWMALVAGIFIALAALSLAFFRGTTQPVRILKFSVQPPDGWSFAQSSNMAMSPDGTQLAFLAVQDGRTELWVRDLDSLSARRLSGTEGANAPFWSPDSRHLAFFTGGKLKKIDANRGPSFTLCDAAAGFGGSWSKDDVIVFAPTRGSALFRVSAAGGAPTQATTLAEGENSHRRPWFLPDGRHFLYTVGSTNKDKVGIYAGDLDSKVRRLIMAVNSNAIYAAGSLLYLRERTLMVQPFDAGKLTILGEAIPIADPVSYQFDGLALRGQFAASDATVLAYQSGGYALVGGDITQLLAPE